MMLIYFSIFGFAEMAPAVRSGKYRNTPLSVVLLGRRRLPSLPPTSVVNSETLTIREAMKGSEAWWKMFFPSRICMGVVTIENSIQFRSRDDFYIFISISSSYSSALGGCSIVSSFEGPLKNISLSSSLYLFIILHSPLTPLY